MSRMDINAERLKELRSKITELAVAIDASEDWGNEREHEERDEMLLKRVRETTELLLRYYAWLAEEDGAVGCLELLLEALR